jgi:hypothetical protein
MQSTMLFISVFNNYGTTASSEFTLNESGLQTIQHILLLRCNVPLQTNAEE